VAIALLAIGGARMGDAHEVPAGPAREEPTTKFEAFVVARCSPCVRESYSLTTLPIAPLRPPGFGPAVASLMARGGEVRLEVVRAYPLGNVAEQVFVMRATLSIKAGEGQLYPVSTGLLDEDEVTALANAVADISRLTSTRQTQESPPDTTETEFRGGSIRVGTIRVPGAEVANIQAGNVQSLRAPTAVETSHAMFLPVSDLPAVYNAMRQIEARIRTLRGR